VIEVFEMIFYKKIFGSFQIWDFFSSLNNFSQYTKKLRLSKQNYISKYLASKDLIFFANLKIFKKQIIEEVAIMEPHTKESNEKS
jgi:hypothetical protein